jgi:TolB protein
VTTVFAGLIGASLIASASPAGASFPGSNGLIAWSRPGFLTDSEIWVMNPDGSDKRALTDTASNDADPAWSPDGSKLVFESVTGNAFNLYVVNADGTGLHQVTTSTNRTDVQPAWSPDGTQIVFSRQIMDGTGAIWIIHEDGTHLRRITGDRSQNSHPSWSPDGSLIAFESDRSGGHDLYLMTPGGNHKRDITNTSDVQEENPNWSPDGTRIAFDSCPAPSYPCPGGTVDYNVFVMNADGSGLTQLTTSPAIDAAPAWSPNGNQIVFRSDATGNTEIYAMRLDGSEFRKLTGGLAGGVDPDWQPLP